MALVPMAPGTTNLAYDDETFEYVIYTGNLSSGTYEVLGIAKQGTTVNDYRGNRALVSPDGALKAADWGSGAPVVGTDATGANGYAAVVITPRRVRYLHAYNATNGAVISIDGGLTDAFAVPAAKGMLFPALDIAEGVTIMGRNLTAGSNYTALFVSVW